jgi:hypothetical protein
MQFELFTGSLLSGTYNFLTLTLPEGWAIQRTRIPPDIYYMGIVNGKRWILEGFAAYFMVNVVTGDTYELTVEVKKASRNRPVEAGERVTSFAGHTAYISQRNYLRGFFKKTKVKELVLRTECDITGRRIYINITSPHDLPEEVLEKMRESSCH